MRNFQKLIFLLLAISTLLIPACSIGPKAIDYDEDQCQRCKMIISQKQFGAELITQKGRIYKYDAIECLIPEVLKNGADHYSHILVTDYYQPGTLISAMDAHYLVSEDLPSPMGGFLSAYSSLNDARQAENQYHGEVYDWSKILETFK